MTDNVHEDRQIVARLLAGDRDSFEEFIDDYYPRLYRFACSRLRGDRDAVEEVVQTTLLKVIENLERYRGEASLFTWICSFCRYEIAAMWRARYGRVEGVELVEDAPAVRSALESLSMAPRTPQAELERSELARIVRSTLDHLPTRYGKVLEMKYLARLSVKEIAQRMRLSPKAVESLLTRSRNAFREGFTAVLEGKHS